MRFKFLISCLLLQFFLTFHLTPASADSGQVEYARYTDQQYHFSVELPRHWSREISNNAIVFSGQQGTEEWSTTINFQVIALETGTTIQSVASQLKSQWATSPGYRLISEGTGKLDGHSAIRVVVTYSYQGAGTPFQQEQFVVQGDSFIYAIAYTAPATIFDRHADKMARAVQSFRILSPDASINISRQQDRKQTENQMLGFIEAVQEFRLQNAGDGSTGWQNFAEADVQQYIETIGRIIWPEGEAASGWAYFFSLALSDAGLVTSAVPVAGFYHPWSDVWVVTQWQKEPTPKIIAAEILLGEWVRTGGNGQLDLNPAWLREKGFRPEQLALAVGKSLHSFDEALHNGQPWQEAFHLSGKADLMEQINYPGVASSLLFAWMRGMDMYAENPAEPVLKSLLNEGEAFKAAGSQQKVDRYIAFSSGTTPYTLKNIQSMPADFFANLVPVYWTGDNQTVTLYLVPAGNPDFCVTLRFHRGTDRLQLDRLDLLNFQEIMKTYLKIERAQ